MIKTVLASEVLKRDDGKEVDEDLYIQVIGNSVHMYTKSEFYECLSTEELTEELIEKLDLTGEIL